MNKTVSSINYQVGITCSVSVLHKLKYNKQNIIEHLLLMGSKMKLNQIVTKPQRVLFLIDTFYLM